MATYSKILASEILWTEEPGGPQCCRVRYDLVTKQEQLDLNILKKNHIVCYIYTS